MTSIGIAQIPPAGGETLDLGGFGVVFKISGAQTGGAFAIVEHPLAPGALAAPPHTHTNEDEITLVLDGEIGLLIGEETRIAPTGSYVVKPRGVPHTFWNPGTAPARIQEIITPAGFEHYFRELSGILAAGGPPDIGRIMETAGRYGLTFHMEQLEPLMRAHNVTLK